MFRSHRAHHQERQIVSIQPPVAVTLCWWPCHVQVGSELPTCTWHGHRQLQLSLCVGGCVMCRSEVHFRPAHNMATDSYQRLYWHNLSLLMMSTMCSKHAET